MARPLREELFLRLPLHFDSLDLDPPGVRCFVQGDLHVMCYTLPLRQNVTQALCTKHISKEYTYMYNI